MQELGKIRRVASKDAPGAPHEELLVLDATTGQNALQQAKSFREVAGVTGLVLTKLDGTAKGGVAIAVASNGCSVLFRFAFSTQQKLKVSSNSTDSEKRSYLNIWDIC